MIAHFRAVMETGTVGIKLKELVVVRTSQTQPLRLLRRLPHPTAHNATAGARSSSPTSPTSAPAPISTRAKKPRSSWPSARPSIPLRIDDEFWATSAPALRRRRDHRTGRRHRPVQLLQPLQQLRSRWNPPSDICAACSARCSAALPCPLIAQQARSRPPARRRKPWHSATQSPTLNVSSALPASRASELIGKHGCVAGKVFRDHHAEQRRHSTSRSARPQKQLLVSRGSPGATRQRATWRLDHLRGKIVALVGDVTEYRGHPEIFVCGSASRFKSQPAMRRRSLTLLNPAPRPASPHPRIQSDRAW